MGYGAHPYMLVPLKLAAQWEPCKAEDRNVVAARQLHGTATMLADWGDEKPGLVLAVAV